MNKAPKGGTYGKNGEWYKGGQFLPSSENTVKGAVKIRKSSGKKVVAPYLWEAAPDHDMLSIYDRIQHKVRDNRKECEYVKGKGFIGLQLKADDRTANRITLTSYGDSDLEEHEYNWIMGLIELFNEGQRWYSLDLDCWHFKNDYREEAKKFWLDNPV